MPKAANRAYFYFYLIACFVLFLFFTLPVLKEFESFCFHAYDIGIYAQILHVSSIFNLNAYISSMDINIFQDHFLVWLGLLGTISPLIPSLGHFGILLDFLFPCLSALPLWWYFNREKREEALPLLLFACAYLLFNRGITSGIRYPFHQDVWATFAIIALGVAVYLKNYRAILAWTVVLILFKEVYQFSIFMLGVLYLYRRRSREEWRMGLILVILCALWTVLVFIVRPWMLGGTLGKGNSLLEMLFFGPHKIFLQYRHHPDSIRRFLEFFLPFIPLFYYMKKQKAGINRDIAPLLIAPFMLNLIPNMWRYHYGAPFCAYLLLLFLPLQHDFKFPLKASVLSIIIALGLNGGFFNKGVTRLVSPEKAKVCPGIPERLERLNWGIDYLMKHDEGKALVQAHLFAQLVKRKGLIYQLGLPSYPVRDVGPFDWVMVEKADKYGDQYNLESGRLATLIEEWRTSPGVEIIADDEWIFLAKGRFQSFK